MSPEEARALDERLEVEILGRLASGVAHDFNNLLTGICAEADLARRALGPDHPANVHLQAILETVAQAMGLTHHVLVNARARPALLRAMDLSGEVQAVTGLLRRVAGDATKVELDLAPGLPMVDGDPAQLAQVLFRIAGRTRLVATRHAVILARTHLHQDRVCLAAMATGEGLAEDSFTPERGFDLAAFERIATEHGAQLSIDAGPGRFSVHLPLPKREGP